MAAPRGVTGVRARGVVVVAATLGTCAGYALVRPAGPWTAREALVVLLGAGMACAVALAFTLRRS